MNSVHESGSRTISKNLTPEKYRVKPGQKQAARAELLARPVRPRRSKIKTGFAFFNGKRIIAKNAGSTIGSNIVNYYIPLTGPDIVNYYILLTRPDIVNYYIPLTGSDIVNYYIR